MGQLRKEILCSHEENNHLRPGFHRFVNKLINPFYLSRAQSTTLSLVVEYIDSNRKGNTSKRVSASWLVSMVSKSSIMSQVDQKSFVQWVSSFLDDPNEMVRYYAIHTCYGGPAELVPSLGRRVFQEESIINRRQAALVVARRFRSSAQWVQSVLTLVDERLSEVFDLPRKVLYKLECVIQSLPFEEGTFLRAGDFLKNALVREFINQIIN